MKEMREKMLKAETHEACNRGEELVAFLYGEASEAEAQSFESHLKACATCRAELAGFGFVRENIGAWREQVLVQEASHAAAQMPALAQTQRAPEPKRSALSALREFFALSPAWLRAATAMAAVLFCALLVFAARQMTTGPNVVFIEKPQAERGYTQNEVNTIIANARREEREATLGQIPQQSGQNVSVIYIPSNQATARVNNSAGRSVNPRPTRNLSPRTELAERSDDENLPGLYSLMADSNKPDQK